MLARLRHYRFDWKLSALSALLLPLLLTLGCWQLGREQEKLALQAQYLQRQQQQAQPLAQLDAGADLQYVQAFAQGRVDNAHIFLLDNRIHQGRAGYDVLVPLYTDTGQLVFINRGWVAQGPSRTELPRIEAVPDGVQLEGSLYAPVGAAFVLGDELMDSGWPRVVQTLDIQALAQQLDGSPAAVFPYTLRLAAGQAGVLVRDWPVVSTSPEKHRGYAVQWFAMAAALVLLYLYYSTRPDEPAAPAA